MQRAYSECAAMVFEKKGEMPYEVVWAKPPELLITITNSGITITNEVVWAKPPETP